MDFEVEDARNIMAALAGVEPLKAGRDYLITVIDRDGRETRGRMVTREEPDGLVLAIYDDGRVHHRKVPWDTMQRISVEVADD